jgi:hypothetical protein
MVDNRGTLTPDEHRVLEMLRHGPADLGARTEATVRHRRPRLWDQANQTLAAARLADSIADDDRGATPLEPVRTVDRQVARRLAGRGLVIIDVGGRCSLPAGDS